MFNDFVCFLIHSHSLTWEGIAGFVFICLTLWMTGSVRLAGWVQAPVRTRRQLESEMASYSEIYVICLHGLRYDPVQGRVENR